jgi:hypothetical protein
MSASLPMRAEKECARVNDIHMFAAGGLKLNRAPGIA